MILGGLEELEDGHGMPIRIRTIVTKRYDIFFIWVTNTALLPCLLSLVFLFFLTLFTEFLNPELSNKI